MESNGYYKKKHDEKLDEIEAELNNQAANSYEETDDNPEENPTSFMGIDYMKGPFTITGKSARVLVEVDSFKIDSLQDTSSSSG